MTRDGEVSEEIVLWQASEELAQVQARIGLHFRRAEVRNRAGRYLRALLAPVERKMAGNWPRNWENVTRMEPSACWLKPTGTRRQSAMNCAAM